MCGRFALHSLVELLPDIFGLEILPEAMTPRFNIAPTQPVAVVTNEHPKRLQHLRWGLIPPWARDLKGSGALINARAETVAQKPSFRGALAERRCLVLADGFYEWRKHAGSDVKSPFHIRMRSQQPFAMAGLWELWRPRGEGEPVASCTVITTRANALMEPIHDRMPVILPQAAWGAWLSKSPLDPALRERLFSPHPSGEMEAYPVSREVNSVKNDRRELLDPAPHD